jgi:hypothetical protein
VPVSSVFPYATLDRDHVRWEDSLDWLTPVENRGGLLYKREDYYAPLGYGGINGAKLRQLIWLVNRYVSDINAGVGEVGAPGLLTGASVLSPQLSMAALVARHYGLPATMVLGATTPESAARHENVAIAAVAGADFIFAPVAYNPALQRTVLDLAATERYRAAYRLPYGISTPSEASPADIEAFHRVGARQAENIPEGVRTIVMTAGSCNSCVSVLYGLARQRPATLERVVLLGIGPTRLQFIEDRLAAIRDVSGVDAPGVYRRLYHHHPDLEADHQTGGPVLLEHHDLHATKFAVYSDRMPFTRDGIDFHPTYEGKIMTYMTGRPGFEWLAEADGDVLFWIVGSAPSRAAMTDAFVRDGLL